MNSRCSLLAQCPTFYPSVDERGRFKCTFYPLLRDGTRAVLAMRKRGHTSSPAAFCAVFEGVW